ncbi:H-NS family nucleoid-associated regulatory protein [Endozoicomonas sp. SCSIO W0465]|uniref:H-NS family histone-like protein n=1 Tax=Endozoicomonas sp. SCSIO W0465 TaxID=2918516 RepID=UPI0020756439|nr:H-NS family nucleoid-associated regulatory protein [Endozoicomonas sp. SCSIO W0465]USE35920.1 H-NS histone family protein [Endozoicomonas sp. SCSIO W0465]
MNIFEEVVHRLSSKTRIRSLFKDVHAEDLERIISRLNDVLTEKQEARAKDEEKRKKKQESVEAIKQIMADRGVSLNDLGLGNLELDETAPKRRRNIQKYTFEYENEAGELIKWEGATTGRLPRDFQAYLERTGKKRLDCALEQIEE